MQGRFAAGELKNLDAALAIDHALDAALQIGERDRVDALPGPDRRVRVAGGARKIARVDDLDEREAGGEFFEGPVTFSGSVAAEGAAHRAVAYPASVAGTTSRLRISRIALREPVKSCVRTDAGFGFAVVRTIAAEKNFFTDAPDLGGANGMTRGAPGPGAPLGVARVRAR